jgi:hypothetical protein
MGRGAKRSSGSTRTGGGILHEWLHEAAACLADTSRELPPPPDPELQPTYELILGMRQQIEQSQRDLIESIQMQSMHTVGSILAHDLHNLSLRLALLSQNLAQFYGDPSFLQSAKRVLDDTVERMRSLVDGFRERQETIVIKLPTDVNDVLRAVIRELQVERVPGIQPAEDYGATRRIWADPFFLASAFRVLIQNAVEAMPGGGQLLVSTSDLEEEDPPAVRVEITDQGIGMTREFMERELFAPFRSGKGPGLGLGMYICRHIIQLHEGTIRVESSPGHGTRFLLTFPVEPRAE